jgi:hypothetical protein
MFVNREKRLVCLNTVGFYCFAWHLYHFYRLKAFQCCFSHFIILETEIIQGKRHFILRKGILENIFHVSDQIRDPKTPCV